MTPEEAAERAALIEKIERKQLIAKIEAKRAAPPPPPKSESEGLDTQDLRGMGQTLLNAQLLGGGDEVVGAVRTGLDRTLGRLMPNRTYDFGGGVSMAEQSAGDEFEMYRKDAEASKDEFQQENPGTALAANLVGGLASPANRVAPTFGAAGKFGSRLTRSAARGAVEGGIGGFLENEDDRLGGAATGFGYGAGLSGALTGVLGGVGRLASDRRVNENLLQPVKDRLGNVVKDADGKVKEIFKPLNLADSEGGLGKAYRNIVGSAYGGGAIGRQESEYINALPEMQRFADDAGEVVPVQFGTRTAIKDVIEWETNAVDVVIDTTARAIKKTAVDGANRKTALAQTQEALKEQTAQRVAQAETAGAWSIIENAIPDRVPAELRAEILAQGNTKEANALLGSWYKNEGFATVKGRQFQWDGSLGRDLKTMLDYDPEFALEVGASLGGLKRIERFLQPEGSSTGRALSNQKWQPIEGDELLAMRNAFAKRANTASASAKGSNTRTIANRFDDLIEDQMGAGTPEFAAYQDELTRWSTKQGISKAVKVDKLADDFTPKQFAAKLSDSTSAKVGLAVAKKAHTAVQQTRKMGDTALKQARAATAAADDIAAKEKSALQNTKRRLGQKKKAITNRLQRSTQGMLPEDQTFWSKAAATAGLSGLARPITGGISLVAGMPIAAGLSTRGAQRAIAGQYPAQEQLARMLREGGPTADITRAVSRTGSRYGAEGE